MALATHDCLQLVPLFEDLDDAALNRLEQLVHENFYQKGDTIFSADDPADRLQIVAAGQAKVYQLAASGREQLLYLLQPGDFDGEASLFTEQTRHSYAEALLPTQICSISRQDFQGLLQSTPQLALNLVNAFGQRISSLENKTTQATTESVESRLANYLIELSAAQNSEIVTLPLKKKDLAIYLGTTPETLSRKLNQLQKQGLLEKETGNRIKILDEDQLEML